jgi:hypothetical protein
MELLVCNTTQYGTKQSFSCGWRGLVPLIWRSIGSVISACIPKLAIVPMFPLFSIAWRVWLAGSVHRFVIWRLCTKLIYCRRTSYTGARYKPMHRASKPHPPSNSQEGKHRHYGQFGYTRTDYWTDRSPNQGNEISSPTTKALFCTVLRCMTYW